MRVEDRNQIDVDFLSGGESIAGYVHRMTKLGYTLIQIHAALKTLIEVRRDSAMIADATLPADLAAAWAIRKNRH